VTSRDATDALLGVVVAAATCTITAFAVDEGVSAVGLVLCAVTGLCLAFRHRYPVAQYVVALGCAVLYDALGEPGGPIYGAAFGSALAMVAASRSWMPAVVAGAGVWVAGQALTDGWTVHLFAAGAVWLIGPVLFGEAMRLRRVRAELAARTREEQARRKIAEERLRIARDVHDVVGHSLATIALQAGVAEHLSDDERARESLAAIRRLSRESLGEVGTMLALLREGAAERAPTPGVDALGRLVSDMRDAGLEVELSVSGDVPEAVGAAAYRIVQESLTNVMRHAGAGARAWVGVAAAPEGVRVEVTDDGRGAPGGLREGNGLVGMRERAAALGGSFSAGAADGGGFSVRAVLPAP
jgi:signal transduction histidine kinase